jgi:signal transduction histidine kinase
MVGTGTGNSGPVTERRAPAERRRRSWLRARELGSADWRASLIDPALTIVGAAFVILMVLGTPLVPPPRFRPPFFALASCTLLILALRFARGLPLVVRAVGAAAATLVAAIVIVSHLGFGPGLTIGMAMMGAMLSISLGRRAAVLYFLAAGIGFLFVGKLVVQGQVELRAGLQDALDFTNWVRWVAVFFVCAVALALVLHQVVERVERSARAQLAADEEHRRCSAALLALAQDPAIESGRLDAAFAAIAEAAAAGLGVARAGVWLLDDDGAALRRVQPPERDGDGQAISVAIAESPDHFAALASGRPVAVEDARADQRTRLLAGSYLEPLGIASILDAPIRFRERLVGVVRHEQVGPRRAWSVEACGFAASLADFAARALAAAERNQKESELRDAYDLLAKLHRQVESAKEEERRHLARELHDELGQTLTALKLRLQMAIRSTPSGAGALGESIGMVDRLIGRARKMSVDLSPPLLDEVGLAPAIRAHLEGNAALSDVVVDLHTDGLDERLPAEIETAAFRVVQESLTNVVRHAQARRVDISVRREDGHLRLRVHDDGRGFDVAEARRAAGRGEHFGVVGMTERIKGLGGTLEVQSNPGEGTEVSATLPVAPPR